MSWESTYFGKFHPSPENLTVALESALGPSRWLVDGGPRLERDVERANDGVGYVWSPH